MDTKMVHRLSHALARTRAAFQQRDLNRMARPPMHGTVVAGGRDADTVLILGAGIASGWGSLTHDLALPGRLARAVSSRTRRGVSVTVMTEDRITASRLLRSIREDSFVPSADLSGYRVVVLSIGVADALERTDYAEWRTSVDSLLDELRTRLAPDAHIILVGIPPISSAAVYRGRVLRIADHHAVRLNVVSERLMTSQDRVRFVPVTRPPVQLGSGEEGVAYNHWTQELAAEVAGLLAPSEPDFEAAAADVAADSDPEIGRHAALLALHLDGDHPEPEFDDLVRAACEVTGAAWGAMSVIDGDVQRNKSLYGNDIRRVPLAQSFCALTVQSDGPFVVWDMTKDARFVEHPAVIGPRGVRFYAGIPIAAPTGERIGALCVLDPHPQSRGSIDLAALRDLALLIQSRLRQRASETRSSRSDGAAAPDSARCAACPADPG
jgi:hypothetical protein